VVWLATMVAWLAITLALLGIFANEWVHTETACPTSDGFNAAEARWGWRPPGPTCAPVADVSGHVVPGLVPSPWHWVAIAVPITVLLVESDAAWLGHRRSGYGEHVRRPDGWEWMKSRVGGA
jgi:hypothetical protein